MECLLLFVLLILPYLSTCNPVRFTPKDAQCIYNNNTYNAGQKFYPEPCMFCKCPKHGGRVQCGIQDCQYLPNCVEHDKRDGECCGSCLRYGCLHSDGQLYHAGAVVSAEQCERCFCPDGGGRIECRKVPCPDTNCVNPVHDEGHCCPRCPNGSNCWLGGKILNSGDIVLESTCRVCSCYNGDLPAWLPGDRQPRAVCYMLTDKEKEGCSSEDMLADEADTSTPEDLLARYIMHRDPAHIYKLYQEFIKRTHHRNHRKYIKHSHNLHLQ